MIDFKRQTVVTLAASTALTRPDGVIDEAIFSNIQSVVALTGKELLIADVSRDRLLTMPDGQALF